MNHNGFYEGIHDLSDVWGVLNEGRGSGAVYGCFSVIAFSILIPLGVIGPKGALSPLVRW